MISSSLTHGTRCHIHLLDDSFFWFYFITGSAALKTWELKLRAPEQMATATCGK